MTKKITKILIANRGEIACRVIKTARKMGIATVAVYSDADRKALHVRMADEAVHIGPSPAIESYLVIDKIIAAAKDTDADAIHPGYGFLSENPDFVRACQKAKITFIGPSAKSMEAMGLKDAAKKLMDAAGVPITPGYHGKDQSPKLLKAQAGTIGYPVLIKAVAGGGGKGMRKVEAEDEFDAALASCQREAKSSFGNDDVLIEKYIQSPRHIEVQVFGDTHGNVVHMFERDCSLQRRHQKVIEEAPAPGMTEDVRKAMTDAAVQAAKAVNYVGAGTVEFIVDGSGKLRKDGFWFMEMNTRLQVEHPVTEMITGLDLVELQIRVAQGEKLPKQKQIKLKGHAIEARLYAEDPANDFLPSVGQLKILNLQQSGRIDTGVEERDMISVFYDPMIAKLITHAPHRNTAIKNLKNMCKGTRVYPPRCNLRFLINCLGNETFQSGQVSTHFIDQHNKNLTQTNFETDKKAIEYAIAPTKSALMSRVHDLAYAPGPRITDLWENSPFADDSGWRLNQANRRTYAKFCNGQTTLFSLDVQKELNINSRAIFQPEGTVVFIDGFYYLIQEIGGDDLNGSFSSNALTAPMPGKIIAVNAKTGDNVKAGDPLIVMEAMKMEMTLEAPRDGVVAEVTAAVDALVTDGELLLSLEEDKEQ